MRQQALKQYLIFASMCFIVISEGCLIFLFLLFMKNSNFAIVDVETTGGSPYFSRIIEIGILRVEHGEVTSTFQSLINPEMPIPEFITRLTGITDAAVAKAPRFDDIKDSVLDMFENAVFVAHNVSFDYSFVKQEFKRVDYGFNSDRLCTVKLSRAFFPEHKHHNLSEIITRYNFSCANRHRAFDDAEVLWKFFQMLEEKFPQKQIEQAMAKATSKTRLGKTRSKQIIPSGIVYEPLE